jgi:hypothetical protein
MKMGEWSDYFEDFPEENPANWVNGRFDPAAAARQRSVEESNRNIAKESKLLREKMAQMAVDAKRNAAQHDAETPPAPDGDKKSAL